MPEILSNDEVKEQLSELESVALDPVEMPLQAYVRELHMRALETIRMLMGQLTLPL